MRPGQLKDRLDRNGSRSYATGLTVLSTDPGRKKKTNTNRDATAFSPSARGRQDETHPAIHYFPLPASTVPVLRARAGKMCRSTEQEGKPGRMLSSIKGAYIIRSSFPTVHRRP